MDLWFSLHQPNKSIGMFSQIPPDQQDCLFWNFLIAFKLHVRVQIQNFRERDEVLLGGRAKYKILPANSSKSMIFLWHMPAKLSASFSQSHCDLAWQQFQYPDIFEPWVLDHLWKQTKHTNSKKSRYSYRRHEFASSCQTIKRMRQNGEPRIMEHWKSFNILVKHSTGQFSITAAGKTIGHPRLTHL